MQKKDSTQQKPDAPAAMRGVAARRKKGGVS